MDFDQSVTDSMDLADILTKTDQEIENILVTSPPPQTLIPRQTPPPSPTQSQIPSPPTNSSYRKIHLHSI